MSDQMDGSVAGLVTVFELAFDSDVEKVEVGYWYELVFLLVWVGILKDELVGPSWVEDGFKSNPKTTARF